MSRVATRDPPSAPELTMVLAGSKPAPGSSWAHINAALSELIDANRQMEFKKSPGSRLRPPFFGVVTFFYTVADAARWRRLTRQVRLPPAPPAPGAAQPTPPPHASIPHVHAAKSRGCSPCSPSPAPP